MRGLFGGSGGIVTEGGIDR